MKVVSIVIFLLLAQAFLFFYPRQTMDAASLQQNSEITEQKNLTQVSPTVTRRSPNNPYLRILNAIEKSVGTRFPFYFGFSLMTGGLAFFFLRETRKYGPAQTPTASRHRVSVMLLVILAIGTILRLYQLDEKSLTHPEVYVPGIALPAGLSAPPPRISWAETLWYHFHAESHPPGYYFLMWSWTKFFGTSEFALRLPSALFGIASIWLIFKVVLLTHSRHAALFAAAMLALNGHHIFWSQLARMYSMTCFLGLLSTLLLFHISLAPAPRPRLEAAYAGVSLIGVFTEIFFWPFLAAQALWAGIVLWNGTGKPDRILRLQSIIMVLGTPLWAHAVYRARPSYFAEPSQSFLQHFFTFGFLISHDRFALQPQTVSLLIAVPLLLIALILAFVAYRKRADRVPDRTENDPGLWIALPIALGAISTTIGFSFIALNRRARMAMMIFVAIAFVFVPWVLTKIGRMIRVIGQRLRIENFLKSPDLLYYLLAFLPTLGLFLLSYQFSLLGTRLFLLFVPFLLILISIGLARIQSKRIIFVTVAATLLAVHLFSVAYFHKALSAPINYKGLAREINERFEDGDLIFVHRKHWAVTPLFYYLADRHNALVADEFDKAVKQRRPGKVFVIHFKGLPPTAKMRKAVKDLPRQDVIEELRAYADIYRGS
jgi:4-amino-4-deoxy-L-arabinose transferase-like glycosyltransferase